MFEKIKKYFTILRYQFNLAIMVNSIYRVNFILMLLQSIVNTMLSVLSIKLIYGNVDEIAGWDEHQMTILVCVSLIVNQLYRGVVLQGQNFFLTSILRGDFDRMLLRPISIVYQINLGKFDLISLSSLSAPVILILYELKLAGLELGLGNVFCTILTIIMGVVTLSAFMMLLYSLAFKYVKADSLMEMYYIIMSMSEKPKEIIKGRYLLAFFTFFIPVIPLANVSTGILVGTSDLLQGTCISLIVGIGFSCLAVKNVHKQMKRYSSASS